VGTSLEVKIDEAPLARLKPGFALVQVRDNRCPVNGDRRPRYKGTAAQ